ncbi:hypothetical protein ACB098_04G029900 [Castanea mollissima]
MAKPLFLPIMPILLLACLCRSHGLRFVYMYQQYMRRRRRKRQHCGFAGGIQALRAHVAKLLILPKWYFFSSCIDILPFEIPAKDFS